MPPSFIEHAHITGMSLSWCKKGSVRSAAAGVIDTSSPQAVTHTTLFQAASLSKAVSAAIVLTLFKEKSWDIDMPLCELFAYGPPEIQNHSYYKMLTTRMILSQSSGLPNWFIGNSKPGFVAQPGTKFTYSGVAFYFLQEVIENKTQMRWEVLAQDFFRKAGMNSATFLPSQSEQKIARGHDEHGCPDRFTPPPDAREIPAASLGTTSQEYIAFLRYCYSDPFLNKTLFAVQTHLTAEAFPNIPDIQNIKWGLGIGLFEQGGRTIAFHWGHNPCAHAFAAIDVKSGDGIACFVNCLNGPNIFKNIMHGVVGDMTPVFDWLAHYYGFTAAVKPIVQPLENRLTWSPVNHDEDHLLCFSQQNNVAFRGRL